MNVEELKRMKISELNKLAKDYKLKGTGGLKKQEFCITALSLL